MGFYDETGIVVAAARKRKFLSFSSALLSVFAFWPNIIFLIILGLLYSPYLPKSWFAFLKRGTHA